MKISLFANRMTFVVAGCFLFISHTGYAATITVSSTLAGKTPQVLGYNLGHFVQGSNVNDFWRYSGVKAARAFISVSNIESTDDISGVGDGVNSLSSFTLRQTALRTNVKADTKLSGTSYIYWSKFKQNYAAVDTGGNNQFSIDYAFGALRTQGVEILANISCSPSRFPLASDTDWANMWEIWQHYYAQTYYLAKNYDVQRYGIMNEPNNWSPSITPEDWLRRLRVTSDAIQAAIVDVNAVYRKTLVAQIFAPNTANGASKYDTLGDNWGQLAVKNRHLKLNTINPDASWWNFHIYNYQKYSMTQSGTSTAYIEDFNSLASKIAADLSGTSDQLPLALTEFNSRTASNYDSITNTSDTPDDYAGLGASLVALTPAKQLYLFKFAMTATTGNTYPVSKNGTHYVDNSSALRSYGGPSSTAEVYRLYNKAAQGGRDVYATSGSPTDIWSLATKDPVSGITYLFISNKTANSVSLDFAVSSLGIADGSAVIVEEVSENLKGAIRLVTQTSSGKVPSANIPAKSIWLISILPSTLAASTISVSENTTLQDGTGKSSPYPNLTSLTVRSDGSVNGRRVSVLKFPLPTFNTRPKRVLLSLRASTIATSNAVQAHVYGLELDSWTEAGATFSSLSPQLKQGVTAGNQIVNNIIENDRAKTKFQGQIWVTSATASEKLIDVTDFVLNQKDGNASFVIVQEHRWTSSNQLKSGSGDTQPDGLKIVSRLNSTAGPSLKVYY